jgi:hypothetical protein
MKNLGYQHHQASVRTRLELTLAPPLAGPTVMGKPITHVVEHLYNKYQKFTHTILYVMLGDRYMSGFRLDNNLSLLRSNLSFAALYVTRTHEQNF